MVLTPPFFRIVFPSACLRRARQTERGRAAVQAIPRAIWPELCVPILRFEFDVTLFEFRYVTPACVPLFQLALASRRKTNLPVLSKIRPNV